MSVKLQKGQKVSLSKENVGLSRIIVGLGWPVWPAGSLAWRLRMYGASWLENSNLNGESQQK